MSLQIGYIDNDGHPRITIRVQGTNPGAKLDVDVLINTGFTGFLMLPIIQALPLGLVLAGTGEYLLADGSLVTNFLAKGSVTVGPSLNPGPPPAYLQTDLNLSEPEDETVQGVIVLPGDGALIGMEFLRNLNNMDTLHGQPRTRR